MAEDYEQRLIRWAQSYNAYERIAATQEHMNIVFLPLRQDWEVSGRIPEWAGVDLLRAWAFYCARAYRLNDWRPLLQTFPELRAIVNAIRNHPAALGSDMPPEPE